MEVPVVAGSIATVVFASSALPMLLKAWRTKDVGSYSLANIALSNLGNVFYTAYVLHLPPGPVWALHSFYTLSTALMLFWYLRYGALASGTAFAGGSVRAAAPRAGSEFVDEVAFEPPGSTAQVASRRRS